MAIENIHFGKPERRLSWEEAHDAAQQLANKIRESGYIPDRLVGIAIGGLIPLALLAEELDIHDVTTISAKSYMGKSQGEVAVKTLPEGVKDKKILLVDEVAETGATLQKVSEALQAQGVKEMRTSTLAINTATCTFKPDFYALGDDAWIVFPWEKDLE